MKHFCASLACSFVVLALLASPASALTMYDEDFDSDGEGTRYTLTGGGGSGDAFWGLNSTGNDVGFTGFGGTDYFVGRQLDQPFAGGANPLTIEIPFAGPINLGGSTGALDILVAAAYDPTWDAGFDYARIVAIDADTFQEFVIDEFLPNASRYLESTFFGPSVVLGNAFQNLHYDLPASIVNLEIRIEAYNTGPREFVGFDELQITIMPEPSTALLLGAGLVALAGSRRRRTV